MKDVYIEREAEQVLNLSNYDLPIQKEFVLF